MHRVRRDGSGLECLYEHGNDEFVVHETFLVQTGDLVFTIWPRSLCTMDWTTRAIRTISSCNAWHIAPNRQGTSILCDTNHPDRGIHLIDVESGDGRLVCLSGSSNRGSQWATSRYALAEDFAAARSQASKTLSWMEADNDTVYGPQWSHPHPSWSNDERKIAFASDRTATRRCTSPKSQHEPDRASPADPADVARADAGDQAYVHRRTGDFARSVQKGLGIPARPFQLRIEYDPTRRGYVLQQGEEAD